MPLWRRVVGWLASAVMLATGAIGSWNVLHEWQQIMTLPQRSVTASVGAYGVLGLVAGVGVILRRAWSYPAAIAWGLFCTYAAGVSVLVYGGPDASIGAALAAAIAGAVVVALVVWGVRVSLSPAQRQEETSPTT